MCNCVERSLHKRLYRLQCLLLETKKSERAELRSEICRVEEKIARATGNRVSSGPTPAEVEAQAMASAAKCEAHHCNRTLPLPHLC